jgi:hypothetical protein
MKGVSSRALRLALWMLGLPRLGRIVLAAVFAIALTLVLTPIIDLAYLRFLYSPQTVMLPALVSVGFGLLMYTLGWWLVVSGADDGSPMYGAITWYALLGVATVVLALVLLIVGVVTSL